MSVPAALKIPCWHKIAFSNNAALLCFYDIDCNNHKGLTPLPNGEKCASMDTAEFQAPSQNQWPIMKRTLTLQAATQLAKNQ